MPIRPKYGRLRRFCPCPRGDSSCTNRLGRRWWHHRKPSRRVCPKTRGHRFVPSRTALHYAARRVGPHFLATLLEIVWKERVWT
jgi:hypothetical protein